MKTYIAKPNELEREWHLFDASEHVLGRLAVRISMILQGKHKPTYTRHVDTGDFVVVIHADKIRLTGKKREQKKYYRYSGYPGGLKEIPFEKMMANRPTEILRLAVQRMLPKNKLGRQMIKKLKIYAGAEHPHQAQGPQKLESLK